MVLNEITGASLVANQITLPAGTYEFFGRCPAIRVNKTQCGLYNITDAVYTTIGATMITDETDFVIIDSLVMGKFTIVTQKVFELRQYTQSIFAAGLGLSNIVAGLGKEVYAELFIKKIN